MQPTLQYKFFHNSSGALVGAAGCLFTIAGQNHIDAIYPNLSLYYYWSRGKPHTCPQLRNPRATSFLAIQ